MIKEKTLLCVGLVQVPLIVAMFIGAIGVILGKTKYRFSGEVDVLPDQAYSYLTDTENFWDWIDFQNLKIMSIIPRMDYKELFHVVLFEIGGVDMQFELRTVEFRQYSFKAETPIYQAKYKFVHHSLVVTIDHNIQSSWDNDQGSSLVTLVTFKSSSLWLALSLALGRREFQSLPESWFNTMQAKLNGLDALKEESGDKIEL